jgi:ParB-like chromosome segregation protein Spo0J
VHFTTGADTVPALVRKFEDWEQMELALVENLQREDLNPVETARAIHQLMHIYNMTQKEVAKRLNKNSSTISHTLNLLNLPTEILNSLERREIQEGHAKALLGIEDKALQKEIWEKAVGERLTVRQTQQLIGRLRTTKSEQNTKSDPVAASLPTPPAEEFARQEACRMLPVGTPESRMQEALMQTFERRVMIRHSYAHGGMIEIGFHDSGDLLGVVNRLLNVPV